MQVAEKRFFSRAPEIVQADIEEHLEQLEQLLIPIYPNLIMFTTDNF